MKSSQLFLNVGSFCLAVLFGLALGALALIAVGLPVWETYRAMFVGSIGSATGFAGSLVYAVPIAFTGLAAAVSFRTKVWNIGAEGQLVMGAFGAAFAALYLQFLPGPLLLVAVLICGILGGAVWALVPAALKIWLNVNEVLSSLMLNYVAILWVDYLVYGPWKDPKMKGWPYSPSFPDNALLPRFGTGGVHLGIVLAVVAAALLYVAIRYSRWGFEVQVVGESQPAARYAGISITGTIALVMFVSGGLAGLAGVGEVAGGAGRLYHLIPGYGYTGILVSWLARHDPLAVLAMALFYGVLMQGGVALQMASVDPSLVRILQAAIILFALAAMTLVHRPWRGLMPFRRRRSAAGKEVKA